MYSVEKILLLLREYLNIRDIQRLGEYFCIEPSAIYTWKKRNKITNPSKILAKHPEIRHEWLTLGEGPMLRSDIDTSGILSNNVESGGIGIVGSTISGKGKVVNQTATIQEGMHLSSEEETLIKLIRRKDKGGDLTLQLIEHVSKM